MKPLSEIRKRQAVAHQRWQRSDPSKRKCDCGEQAVKFSKGFVCQRCLDIETNFRGDLSRATCGFGGSYDPQNMTGAAVCHIPIA